MIWLTILEPNLTLTETCEVFLLENFNDIGEATNEYMGNVEILFFA